MVDCAVLREVSLTAREVLNHRVLNSKLYELEKQEWKDRKERALKNEELKNKLKAAEKAIAKFKRAVVGSS